MKQRQDYPFLRVTLSLVFSAVMGIHPAYAEFTVTASSYLGDASNDEAMRGAAFQTDGTIILGGTLGASQPAAPSPVLLNGATSASTGAVMRLAADGKSVRSVTRLADSVFEIGVDASDNIYVAAANRGIIKLNPSASQVLWTITTINCKRLDVAATGECVVLTDNGIYVYDATGAPKSDNLGLYNETHDVAINTSLGYVYKIGFTVTSTGCEPILIPYIFAQKYDGTLVWTDYNFPGNYTNCGTMRQGSQADTRGYRVVMGKDGKLYAGFESHGGNTLIRYDPHDIMLDVVKAAGDNYNNSSNMNGAAAISHVCRCDPATGDVLLYQTFVTRLPNGKANACRIDFGDLRADSKGRVYLGGSAAYALPLTFTVFPSAYLGGAYLQIISSDFTTRILSTRLSPSGYTRCIAVYEGAQETRVVWGGDAATTDSSFYLVNPIQSAAGGGTTDGCFSVANEPGGGATVGQIPPRSVKRTLFRAGSQEVYTLRGQRIAATDRRIALASNHSNCANGAKIVAAGGVVLIIDKQAPR